MQVLTQTEARAAKAAIKAFLAIGQSYFSITIGEAGAAAKIECDEGIVTLTNAKTTEVYGDIQSFSTYYGV
jgi:hypothetical protein